MSRAQAARDARGSPGFLVPSGELGSVQGLWVRDEFGDVPPVGKSCRLLNTAPQ